MSKQLTIDIKYIICNSFLNKYKCKTLSIIIKFKCDLFKKLYANWFETKKSNKDKCKLAKIILSAVCKRLQE